MLALTLLLAAPADPVIPGSAPSAEAQWAAIAACPRVSAVGQTSGTGVVVGTKGEFAYLLTAAHVVPFDGVELAFTSRKAYPKPEWYAVGATVVNRWHDADLALIRFKVPAEQQGLPVPQLP